MTDRKSERGSLVTDRRRLLIGLGVAGGAMAAGLRAPLAAEAAAGQVTDAPLSDKTQEHQPFYARRQSGIVTARPAAGMVATFDVVAKSPPEVRRLFKTLTDRIAFLMNGGTPPARDPRLPPADSGILGPVIAPDNLTMTLSVGASFFEQRDWLAHLKPARLTRMVQFPNDALDHELCHGDLCLQICSNGPDTNIHALRDILKNLPDLLLLRWKQEGTVPVLPPKAGGVHESARNLLGFRDGSANPDATNHALMDRVVWVSDDKAEPDWAKDGTYQVVRIIRNFVERWDRTPLGEQEQIIGRRKANGAPFDGMTEHDVPDYVNDPAGKITPLDAHIRLANPRTPATAGNLILRRPFNYSNGVSKSGQLEQGLLFIAYQADIEKGFIAVQSRLNGEPLEEYIKPIGGGYFFVLPGAQDKGDFLGRTLLEAAGYKTSDIKS